MSTEPLQTSINDAAQAETLSAVTPVVGGGDLLSLGVSMFIVVGVIVLLGWLYSRSRFVAGGAGHLINVIASRALGPKERLMIVEVADQQLLIGMTASAVQTLHVFEEPVETVSAAAEDGFASRLRTAVREWKS